MSEIQGLLLATHSNVITVNMNVVTDIGVTSFKCFKLELGM